MAKVYFDKDRKPLYMIGTAQDITEQKRVEHSLKNAIAEIMMLKEMTDNENIIIQEDLPQEKIPGIIGVSKAIKYVMYRIRQVAATKTTVLFLGETGTGKGIFARFLHESSDRGNKPFVKVNCAGLPPNLIESELFGREKGAFTGSTGRQIGRFELANGGTIFLDEIGELPLELQAKLLKVIEDEVFERLGSPHPVKVNVRIIASTNRDLEEEMKRGHFRRDLFYRINVFPITIPPLRHRKEDVAPLVKFYIDRFNKSLGKKINKIQNNIILELQDYDWKGNVRELSNIIERSVIQSNGHEFKLSEKLIKSSVASATDDAPNFCNRSPEKNLWEIEQKHILNALEEAGWRIEGPHGAAHRLGLNPSTLRGKMKKLSIKRPGTY